MNPFLWLFVIIITLIIILIMPNSCEIVFPIQVLSHSIGMKVRDSSSNCKSRTNDLVMVFVNDVVVVYGPHSRLILYEISKFNVCLVQLPSNPFSRCLQVLPENPIWYKKGSDFLKLYTFFFYIFSHFVAFLKGFCQQSRLRPVLTSSGKEQQHLDTNSEIEITRKHTIEIRLEMYFQKKPPCGICICRS